MAGDELYSLGSILLSTSVTFRLYADGELKFSKNTDGVRNVFRLPKGYNSDRQYISLSGYIPVKRVVIATSADEL